MELHLSVGTPELEYILKYVNKGFKNLKHDERLLAEVASVKENDHDRISVGDVKKMLVPLTS